MLALWNLTPGTQGLRHGRFCDAVSISGARTIVKSISLATPPFGGRLHWQLRYTLSSKGFLSFVGNVGLRTTRISTSSASITRLAQLYLDGPSTTSPSTSWLASFSCTTTSQHYTLPLWLFARSTTLERIESQLLD